MFMGRGARQPTYAKLRAECGPGTGASVAFPATL